MHNIKSGKTYYARVVLAIIIKVVDKIQEPIVIIQRAFF